MQRLCALGLCALSSLAAANEPLFVPRADYAAVPPGTPLQPQPDVQFGLPAPLPGSSVAPPASLGGPLVAPPVMEGYPLSVSPLPLISGVPVPLYPNVRVRSAHLAYPGGVSEVVQIPNPLPRSGDCEPVYVQICVPPGCPPQVTVGPRGQRLTYAFGGYRVQVTSLRGVVTVDYDRR